MCSLRYLRHWELEKSKASEIKSFFLGVGRTDPSVGGVRKKSYLVNWTPNGWWCHSPSKETQGRGVSSEVWDLWRSYQMRKMPTGKLYL